MTDLDDPISKLMLDMARSNIDDPVRQLMRDLANVLERLEEDTRAEGQTELADSMKTNANAWRNAADRLPRE